MTTPAHIPSSGIRRRNNCSVASFSNSSLMRFLVCFIGLNTLSIPLVLHYSLSDAPSFRDCGNTLERPNVFSVGNTETSIIRGPDLSTLQAEAKPEDVLYSLQRPPKDSPYTIIHTVLTRFMVGQPSKYVLARARYLLFTTFCWPTMLHQTNQNFYWMVLVDPRLDVRILNDMRTLLQTMPFQNAFMVLTSNSKWVADGVGVANVTTYGVGLRTIAEEFQRGAVDIVTGNTTFLLQALKQMDNGVSQLESHHSVQPILAIETLLDADDGLNKYGVESIQDVALRRQKVQQDYFSSSSSPHLNDTWWFLCGTDHIEWHNRDIYRISPAEYALYGISSGLTGVRSSPFFCTSAGFTRVGLTLPPSTMEFPRDAYSNHALAFYFPQCTSLDKLSHTPTPNISMSHCWRREFPGSPFIVKSRSLGSDSMDNMSPNDHDYRDVPWLNATQNPLRINETEIAWALLVNNFAINRFAAWETSTFLYHHRREILRENRDSRCAPGFPCYKTAKKNLVLMERYWAKQETPPKGNNVKFSNKGPVGQKKNSKAAEPLNGTSIGNHKSIGRNPKLILAEKRTAHGR